VVEVYNPATSSWTTLAHMPIAVVYAGSVSLDGQLYVFGGTTGSADVATVQAYDPHKNKWRTLSAVMPAASSSFSSVVVYGLVFTEGGDGGSAVNQYSPFGATIP
jgi:N-acetylneuraminic acid mutarotase